ncbi:MAG: hypothetical protein HC807_05055 [Gammaproteobacteria bacterium]|nr:hypothetical protein [Gammaproteobacteria bacterium]
MVGRILRAKGIGFTALDASSEQVDFVARYGNNIYYGDASRLAVVSALADVVARQATRKPAARARIRQMVLIMCIPLWGLDARNGVRVGMRQPKRGPGVR